MQDSSEQSGMEEHQIIVDVDYNLLLIQDHLETRLLGVADEGERWFLRTEPDRVVIHTGQWGPVAVTVQVRDTAPSPVDEQFRSRWEDIAARSFITSSEDMRLGSITGGHVPDIDTLTLAGPGSYRIRAAAVGRTRYWDAVAPIEEQPAVRMLLQVWPAEPSSSILHQYKDRFTGSIVRADESKPA